MNSYFNNIRVAKCDINELPKYNYRSHLGLSSFDGLYEAFLLEGYAATYNSSILYRKLREFFNNEVEFDQNVFDIQRKFTSPKFGIATSINITVPAKHSKRLEELKKLLSTLGYYISNYDEQDGNLAILIEPKYGMNISEYVHDEFDYLYHITTRDKLDKIKKYGLAPRGSETTYYHPKDRIYLIYGEDRVIKLFKTILARNKGKSSEDMVILKVPVNRNIKYYIDDTTYREKDDFADEVLAVFILQNIHPKDISIV